MHCLKIRRISWNCCYATGSCATRDDILRWYLEMISNVEPVNKFDMFTATVFFFGFFNSWHKMEFTMGKRNEGSFPWARASEVTSRTGSRANAILAWLCLSALPKEEAAAPPVTPVRVQWKIPNQLINHSVVTSQCCCVISIDYATLALINEVHVSKKNQIHSY